MAASAILPDGTVELGFRGDEAGAAGLLRAAISADIPIASFSRAASDLEELFLQVTGQDDPQPGSEAAA